MNFYNNNYIKGLILAAMVAFVASGCKKILSPDIKGQIALEQLVQTEAGMITVTNSMYSPLISLYSGPMQRMSDLASDDGWTWRNELEPDLFIVTPSFLHSNTIWTNLYRGLSSVNIVLARADGVPDFSSNAVKDAIKGQAYFMRAFYYFNLVRLFGGVPLITNEVQSREDAELPRAAIEDIYARIKSDLDSAALLLPATYTGSSGMEQGRPTSYSAHALKSIVCLELNEWDASALATAEVVGHGGLLNQYADNFNGKVENGGGSLFEVQYAGSNPATSTGISNFYAPTSYRGAALILPTDDDLDGGGGGPSSGNSFVQAIEAGDLRRNTILATYDLPNFIDATKPAGSLFYVNKYYNAAEPVGRSSWNFPLIRYAEILLVRAEALNEKQFVADGEAFDRLNEVRTKAGLGALSSADLPDQEAFRAAVMQERRIELSFECKRFFDLNRWGLLEANMQPQLDYLGLNFPSARTISHPITGKPYFLYPIPGTEFVNNAKLGQQNPGYD